MPTVRSADDLLVTPLDRAMSAFAATTPVSFHLALDFDGQLELDVLERSWQRLGRRVPILRGELSSLAALDRWRLNETLHPLVHIVESDLADPVDAPWSGPAEAASLHDDLGTAGGAACRLTVVERGDRHRLVWTGHHALTDGSSTVAVIRTLAQLYGEAVSGETYADIRSTPDPGPDAGTDTDAPDTRPRDLDDLLTRSGLDPTVQALVLSRYLARWNRPEHSDHPSPTSRSIAAGYAGTNITELLALTASERRRRGWRTSAVLIALIARAWNRVFDDGHARRGTSGWQVASNLRTELGVDAGIGNLSGTEPLTLHAVDTRPLAAVIDEANRSLAALASGWPGLGAAMSASTVGRLAEPALSLAMRAAMKQVTAVGYSRSFSNVGAWPDDATHWGDRRMTQAFYAPAFTDPAWCTAVAYHVSGRSWLSMRTHQHGISVRDVQRLGHAMLADVRAQ